MSNTLFQSTIKNSTRNARLISFSIAPQGAAAPKIISGTGIKSVTRTSAGLYVVNFAHAYRFLIEAQLTPQFSALTATTVQFVGLNVKASGTGKQSASIQCLTTTTGAAVDIAANANNLIYGEIFVQNA
jgi:hypothetical protein